LPGFPKPIIIVSKCFEFYACRYNGARLTDKLVQKLQPFVIFKPICPEVEIGLGTPRPTIRLVRKGKSSLRLVQPETGRDITDDMNSFSEKYLSGLSQVDGFILKKKSPSCGIRSAKVFGGAESKRAVAYSESGLFAEHVLERFGGAAIEDEGRLNDIHIRHHFLTRLFTLAAFRHLKKDPSAKKLVGFQAADKLLLMAYNQVKMRAMGKLVANLKAESLAGVLDQYEVLLREALYRKATVKANINVLQHALGYFKDELTAKEKQHFLNTLESYREQLVPLSTVTAVLNTWAAKYERPYLTGQTFFNPYPHELTQIPVV
jgi:uncharacterized protein YbgA (DUF1722 family)/uncharacterized protein YbbK (DUF523 family)